MQKSSKILLIIALCWAGTLSTSAETLTFNSFLETALQNSYKLKASKIDTGIAKASVKEARAGYFPTLSGYATTERYNDLSDGTRQITAVGNEILLNRDYYQDVAAVGLNYNLFDFGIRKRTLQIAKADDKQKETLLLKDTRDLKLDVVDLYGETLALYKALGIKREILSLQNELFTINSRLRGAGELSEIEVTNSEIDISETKSDIAELENNLSKRLTEFSYYTNRSYSLNDTELTDFPETTNNGNIIPINVIASDQQERSNPENQKITLWFNNPGQSKASPVIASEARQSSKPTKLSIEKTDEKTAASSSTGFDIQNSLEAKTYDLEILKKQKEYEIQKRANFPKISFDARYNLYGSDDNNFAHSFSDFEQRSLSFRISTSFTMFDGMKNINTVQKRKMEVEKLKVQKEQELAELKKKYEQIRLDAENSILQGENNKRTLSLVNKNLENLERLNTNGIIAKAECVKKKLELLDKKQKLEETRIRNYVAGYKLGVLNENMEL